MGESTTRYEQYQSKGYEWIALFVVLAAIILLKEKLPWLNRLPPFMLIHIEDDISVYAASISQFIRPLTRFLTKILEPPLETIRGLFLWLPWLASIAFAVGVGLLAGGFRLAIFVLLALFYVLVTGLWTETMATLATVSVAVPLAVVMGFLIGLAGYRTPFLARMISALLDLMQTVPTFAYLIPMLVLFGVGPVVGMLASAIYAIPPIARSVMLGLNRVPTEIIESSRMAGSSPMQELLWIRLPTAVPTIMLGMNQTIMAVLSMVVIASILGGFPDAGWAVYSTMKMAKFGESITAGLSIALLAMILDRTSAAFASTPKHGNAGRKTRIVSWIVMAVIVSLIAAHFAPMLAVYPEVYRISVSGPLNGALDWFTREFFWATNALRDFFLLNLLIPLNRGAVTGFVANIPDAGFRLLIQGGYMVVLGLVSLILDRLFARPFALTFAFLGLVYGYGFVGLPWLAIIALLCTITFISGGVLLTLGSLVALLLIALTNIWDLAMASVQLTLAGVLIAALIGTLVGIWAAVNDRVSAILRPINDTLQTMPSFVFLIPAIMVFLVGEFTGLVAIVLYSVAPSIRFTELGIRKAPEHVVEAATALGATPSQILWHIKVPLALPEIMLGLNQTVMMAFAMVVVAALVGAKGLGQEIMVALTWMDAGKGLVAGLGVAALAMIADRTTQGWSSNQRLRQGL